MQLYTDGDKKQANLRQLINYAKSYEASSSDIGGVSGFIRYIDTIIAAGKDFEASKISSTSDNSVSIKTMHKSKGLEYPFVFIVETSTKFRYDNPVIQMSTDNRIGFTINNHELIRRYRTIPYTQIQRKNKSDVISEEMRLFYVALTRAKQKLFISFKLNDKTFKSIDKLCKILSDYKGNIKLSAMKADRMSDWIWLTLIKHNKFKDIADIIGYYFNYDYDNKLSDDVFEYDRDRGIISAILSDLAAEGVIHKVNPSYYISTDAWNKAVETARSFEEEFTIAEYRDRLGTSRKYASELLPAFDKEGITVFDGNSRTVIRK
jgi:ATP-dependent helicase/nuclease subunit A